MTDVLLDQGDDGSFIVLEGRVVKAAASDFMLDSKARRIGSKPFRRALVHDQGDGLTVNFANDYQGGVALNGVRELVPLRSPRDGTAIGGLETTPMLVVRGGLQFEVHSQSPLTVGGDGGGLKVETFFLHEELKKLRSQLSVLAAKVAALESK